jgi:hypothetical protein
MEPGKGRPRLIGRSLELDDGPVWVTSRILRDEHLSPGFPPIADLCLEPTAIAGAQDLAENEIAVFGPEAQVLARTVIFRNCRDTRVGYTRPRRWIRNPLEIQRFGGIPRSSPQAAAVHTGQGIRSISIRSRRIS